MGFLSILGKIGKVAGNVLPALATGGASLPLTIGLTGAAGLAGALSNTKGARTGQQTNTTMPIENPAYASLGELLRARAMQRLNSSMDMSGYESRGIQDINDTFGGISQSVNNSLTSRGLGTSPVAASADATIGTGRGSEIARYLATIPQLQRQMQNEDFTAANALYAGRPLGSTQSGTVINPGSAAGGALDNMASFLGYLYRQKQLGTSGAPVSDGGWG